MKITKYEIVGYLLMALAAFLVLLGYEDALTLAGYALMVIGMFCSVVGAVGLVRFPDTMVRVHAATVSVIGGSVVPLMGLALLTYGLGPTYFGKSLIIAAFIFITSPVGSHAIIRATYKSNVPLRLPVCDKLKEEEEPIARDRT